MKINLKHTDSCLTDFNYDDFENLSCVRPTIKGIHDELHPTMYAYEQQIEQINQNNQTINMLDELNNELELGSLDSIDKLDNLREDIVSRYTFSDYSNKLVIEKGATENNVNNNSLFTATLCKDGEENSSVSLHKDGTIKITCKDFLIERKE